MKICGFFICHTLPISRVEIAEPIVVARHEEHKRKNTSVEPILPCFAYWSRNPQIIRCTDRKRNYVLYKVQTYYVYDKNIVQRRGLSQQFVPFLTHLNVRCTLPLTIYFLRYSFCMYRMQYAVS